MRDAVWVALLGWVSAALAQYPGHIEDKQKDVQGPRAIAVLEWTGEAGKPSASRLVPITVYDGGEYQDAGIYLARPEPLALESGTEYELEKAGTPQGWFDVEAAQQVAGDWFGFGFWRPFVSPAPKKLQTAREMPQVVKDQTDDSRPHFKNKTGSAAPQGTSQPASGGAGQSPNTGGASPNASGGGNGNANTGDGKSNGSAQQPEVADPERPTLRRRPHGETSAKATVPAETAIVAPDPDRPRLERGKPANLQIGPEHLQTTPIDLQQMVAVSDARNAEPQSFQYEWPDAGDSARFQQQLLTAAGEALRKAAGAQAGAPAAKTPAPAQPSTQPKTQPRTSPKTQPPTAAGRRAAARRAAAKPAAPEWADVQFRSFALTYSGGATLVLTAKTAGASDAQRTVTVIAQPDIYGALKVLLTVVSDPAHLEDAPAMRLVDAVDTAGDRRGDLLFELRGATSRHFGLYRVASGRAESIFTTDPLPLKSATP